MCAFVDGDGAGAAPSFLVVAEGALRAGVDTEPTWLAALTRAGEGATFGTGLAACTLVLVVKRRVEFVGASGCVFVVVAMELDLVLGSGAPLTFFYEKGLAFRSTGIECIEIRTWILIVSTRLPFSLITMVLGGLSNARRSMYRSFPFSVPK